MTNKDFHVLIIGGGNCGLAIATGLKKHGIKFTIFERESEHDYIHKTRNWGMLMHWSTEYFLKLLPSDLQSRIREVYVDPEILGIKEPIPYFDALTGEVKKRIESDVINRVSRLKIRKFLTEGQGLRMEFGKILKGVEVVGEEGVRVEFEDGEMVEGSMVIGADGSRSKVREFLVGKEQAELERVDHTMINFPYSKYTAEEVKLMRSFHPITQLGYHESLGAVLLAVLDAEKGVFQNYMSWSGPPYAEDLKGVEVRKRFFVERARMVCEPFRTAALAVVGDEDVDMPVFNGGQWEPKMKWENFEGRVTIAGDASHPMLPHRGQGLNNALKDASDIVDAVRSARDGKSSLAKAITEYEEEMRPRGAEEVRLSFLQMEASQNGNMMNSPLFKTGHKKVT